MSIQINKKKDKTEKKEKRTKKKEFLYLYARVADHHHLFSYLLFLPL